MRERIRRLGARLIAVVRRQAREDDFAAELAAHLELATEDLIARGYEPHEAQRRARIALGSPEAAKQLHRESRGLPLIESILRDARLAGRSLRRDLGMTCFAVLIVGLGVAASTLVFSVASALLLRPLPFEAPERLVWIANGSSSNLSAQTTQVGHLLDLRARSLAFADIAGYSPFYGAGDLRLQGAGEPRRLTGVPVTPGFFRLLGVAPLLGQDFAPAGLEADSVMLSHGFWQRHFDRDPAAIGSRVILNREPKTIIGVLPASFDFASTFSPGRAADLFLPFPLSPENDRNGNTLAMIGRLAPGVGLAAAHDETVRLADAIGAEQHAQRRNELHPRLRPLREHISGDVRAALLILAGAVGLMMLIVCANLSNLLLVRAQKRQREVAVQLALGASRGQLIQRLLIESLMMSGSGALLGFALAAVGTGLVTRIEGTEVPLLHAVHIDLPTLTFTILLTVLTGLLFGLAPAFRSSRRAPARALGARGRGATDGPRSRWLRSALVVGEIALTCILLTAVGLLLRSLMRALEVDLGFDQANVLALRIDAEPGAGEPAQRQARLDALLDAARAVPGVAALGLTDALPFGDNFGWRRWDSTATDTDISVSPLVRLVDEGYLSTLRARLKAGRFFTAADRAGSALVAVVNEPLAARMWPDRSALGQTLRSNGNEHTVIGIVNEARYFGLERASGEELYLLVRQVPIYASIDLVVRTDRAPLAVVPALRRALRQADPSLPTADVRTLESLVERSTFARRAVLSMVGGFGGFGLLLASLGVYGVIAYAVCQRRRELGVRLACGATPGHVRRTVIGAMVRPAATGLGLGVVASLLAARALRGVLYGVGAADPLTYVAVVAVVLGSTALAAYLPARQAARLDVASVLRAE